MDNEYDDLFENIIDLRDHSIRGRIDRILRDNSKLFKWIIPLAVSIVGLCIVYLK